MRGKTRDFWALAEAGMLPRETLNYVPKFLAAVTVGRNLKKFGFKIKPEEIWEDYETVTVPSGVQLKSIADATKVPLEVLKRWNADFIRGHTPYLRAGVVDIYVPKQYGKNFEDNRASIDKIKRQKPDRNYASFDREEQIRTGDGTFQVYVVRRGDSLFSISKKLGLSSRTLMKINGLRKSRIHAGQRLKYVKGT
jgi:membrane-bound lytic murein transglycosylase D